MPALDFRVVGQGQPLVLVAGVACDDTVWAVSEQHWQGKYELHMARVAGFAGRPAVQGPLLPRIEAELGEYLAAIGSQPALIGHSMGGNVALAIAARQPSVVGPVVVVDALPDLGELRWPDVPPEQRRRRAERITREMAARTPAQLRRDLEASISAMVVRPGHAELLMELAERSDPHVVAAIMEELHTRDLRPEMKGITSAVLVLLPDWSGAREADRHGLAARYRHQLRTLPDVTVRTIANSRHFVMLDAPAAFHAAVDEFIEG